MIPDEELQAIAVRAATSQHGITQAEALALVAECKTGRERERKAMARAVRWVAQFRTAEVSFFDLAKSIESGEVEIP